MKKAARIGDPIGHSPAMSWLVKGLLIGAAVGLAAVAIVGTGGLAAVAVVGGLAAGGAGIGEAMSSMSFAGKEVCGAILKPGSPNVRVNGAPLAARAHLELVTCSKHSGQPPIAEGSSTVRINLMPAARVDDHTSCGAVITDGSPNVRIGGGTVQTDVINPENLVPGWVHTTLLVVGIASAVILAGPVVAAFGLAGSFAGGYGGSWLGGKLFGEGSDGQKWMALGGSILGGMAGGKIGARPAGFLGERIGGPTGAFVEGGVPGVQQYNGQTPVNERICSGRDPVDAVSGEVLLWKTDFLLPGALEISLSRYYASNSPHTSCFGPHWASTWGEYIEAGADQITYYTGDGRILRFAVPPAGSNEWIDCPTANQIHLRPILGGFEVRTAALRRISRFASYHAGRWQLSGIRDLNGYSLLFHYDAGGALREVLHSGGSRLTVQGTAGQIQRVALATPASEVELVRYEYDTRGRLVAVIDGSGQPFRYSYDSEDRLTRWEDRNGGWYEYQFDDQGRCVESSGPDRLFAYQFFYDPEGRSNIAIDSLGQVWGYRYNDREQVVAIRDPRGGVFEMDWDERGNLVREKDGAGRETVREFAPDGRLLLTRDALGRATATEYGPSGVPAALIDAAGHRWERDYDAAGNLIAARGPDHQQWNYRRDANGNLTGITDPAGYARSFQYDARGLMVSLTDWQAQRTLFTRDALGRVVQEVDPLGRITQYQYNALGKLESVVLPGNTQFAWEYDAQGNVTSRREADGQTYSYRYGSFALLTEVHKPAGGRLQLWYDTEARLTTVENELGQQWIYEYNATGQVIRERDFHGRLLQSDYDLGGLLSQRFNGAGEETLYQRDAAGQLLSRTSSDGSNAAFAYDPLGRITRAVAGDITATIERDPYGRVTYEAQGSHWVRSAHDSRGLRLSRQTSGGQQCDWQWDANGQARGLSLDGDEFCRFSHDAGRREIERRLRGGVVLRQQYDALDRLTSQSATGGVAAPLVSREYRYNLAGDPTEIQDSRWGRSQFTYNPDGRIAAQERENGDGSEAFRYDNAGNLENRTVQRRRTEFTVSQRSFWRSRNGRLERSGQSQYQWDGDGRLIEKTEDGRRWRYEWSAEGRLRAVVTPAGERWQYDYDAFGRRVRKTGPRGTTDYLWDDAVIAEEINGESSTGWVFEPGTFRPLAKQQNQQVYACVTDQVGTPRELINLRGRLSWAARLSTWGELESAPNQATDCPIRFQGQWLDEESGLAYNLHRYYDPATGQYLSPDPLGLPGGTRGYGYVHNPLAWVDPYGLAGNPATSTHIHYVGVDRASGLPYSGYASMPGQQPGDDVLAYRYSGDFSRFQAPPDVVYEGYGSDAKATARGLEQQDFERFGGLQGTANKQNPVGERNPRAEEYSRAANEYQAEQARSTAAQSATSCG